jgi:nitroreductase
VGTAVQTMLLAAHAIGLGAGPVMSFSKAAVGVILQLPDHLSPEALVCLGHPAPEGPPAHAHAWADHLAEPHRLGGPPVDRRVCGPEANGQSGVWRKGGLGRG